MFLANDLENYIFSMTHLSNEKPIVITFLNQIFPSLLFADCLCTGAVQIPPLPLIVKELEFPGLAFYVNEGGRGKPNGQVDFPEGLMFTSNHQALFFLFFTSIHQATKGLPAAPTCSPQFPYQCSPKETLLHPTTTEIHKCWHLDLPSFWPSHHSLYFLFLLIPRRIPPI